MHRQRLALAAALALTAGVTTGVVAQGARAKADIKGDGITGTAEFREVDAQLTPAHDMKYMTGMKAVETCPFLNSGWRERRRRNGMFVVSPAMA